MESRQGSRSLVYVLITCGIVAAVLAVVVFAVPFGHNDVFWTAAAFIGVAVVASAASNAYVVLSSHSSTSALYRMSISALSIGYLCLAAVINLIIMAVYTVPLWVVLVFNGVVLALFLLGFVGGHSAPVYIERDQAQTIASVSVISELRMRASADLGIADSSESKSALRSLVDALDYADPVSSPATQYMDQNLLGLLTQIELALQVDDTAAVAGLCGQAEAVLKQRAAVCKAAKVQA